ncbi:MAG: fatty acid desaturase [Oceanococcaceae bacterium]
MTTTTFDMPWHDSKRWAWLLSPALPVLALATIGLYFVTGYSVFLWGGPILLYVVIPVFDWLVGTDEANPPESAVGDLEDDRYYRSIVYAYIPAQYLLTVLGAWMVATQGLSPLQIMGLLMTVGTINGVGINTAHELGHKTNGLERWLAKITLAPVAYGHFFVEHNRGHHKNVATPEDPASSRMGESFWAFLPRTAIGSLRSAWGIERERLARLGKGVWSVENENLQAFAMTVVLFGGLALVLGPVVLPFLILQAAFGAALLEVVNYLEHYGLKRRKMDSGRFERCQPEHSWNSNHTVTNLFLYQLQRHSDHHAHPTRRYQALRHFEQSPQLPSGYASMILLAYFTPLWFRVMDPKVVAHYQGDLSRINMHEPARKRLEQRWGTAPTPTTLLHDDAADLAPIQASAAVTDWQCPNCDHVYREAAGEPRFGFAPGTSWSQIPDDFSCPDCSVRDKADFVPLEPSERAA